jgi:periplasmic divalent cation tolerance protein
MKSNRKCVVVLVTAPSLKVARALAGEALKRRLVACANLVPGLESHYWWEGKLERSREVLMVMKTAATRVPSLRELILEEHPYDTAEFVVVGIQEGSRRYLDWIRSATS